MNSNASPWRNGSQTYLPGMEGLPEGFFEANPRGTHPRKIFDDDPQPKLSPPKNTSNHETHDYRDQLRTLVSSQLKTYLTSLKSDILVDFNNMLRQSREDGKINNREIQEIKGEIIDHQTKFEHIQNNIRDIGRKFSEINRNCIGEIENLKDLASNQGGHQPMDPSQIGTLKKEVLKDVRQQLKKESGRALPEMQEFKSQFDGQLRNHFEQLNERIKSVEDTIQDIRRNKFRTLENMKKELSLQMTNTQDALVEDNSSLKAQLEHFLKEQQREHGQSRGLSSPGSKSMETPSANKYNQLERRVEETNRSVNGLSSRITEQMSSLERSTMNKVSSIQNDINSIREIALAHKNSPKGKAVTSDEVQNFTSSVEFLKNITSSCQEQILALQNQISLLRGERSSALGNENHLRELENRVEDLKRSLSTISQKQVQLSSTPTRGAYTDYTGSTLQNSSSGNLLNNTYLHKNPFNEGSTNSGDLTKKFDAVTSHANPYSAHSDYKTNTSDVITAGYSNYRPPLELKTSDYLKNSSYIPGVISSPNNKATTPSAIASNVQHSAISSTPDSKPYYGDPKIKSLIEELTKGKRSDVFGPTSGSDRNLANNPTAGTSFSSQSPNSVETFRLQQQQAGINQGSLSKDPSDYKYFDSFGAKNPRNEFQVSASQDYGKPTNASSQWGKNSNPVNDNAARLASNNSYLKQNDEFHAKNHDRSVPNDKTYSAYLQHDQGAPSYLQGGNLGNYNKSADDKHHNAQGLNALVLSPKVQEQRTTHKGSNSKKERTKAERFQLILSQIDYFLHGRISPLLEENEDEEIYCNLDDDGYIFDEDGDYVSDAQGNRVRLSPDEIEKFKNENMIE